MSPFLLRFKIQDWTQELLTFLDLQLIVIHWTAGTIQEDLKKLIHLVQTQLILWLTEWNDLLLNVKDMKTIGTLALMEVEMVMIAATMLASQGSFATLTMEEDASERLRTVQSVMSACAVETQIMEFQIVLSLDKLELELATTMPRLTEREERILSASCSTYQSVAVKVVR